MTTPNRITTWRAEITLELKRRGLTWGDVLHCTLTGDRLDREFDRGFGAPEGDPFTLWTPEWVLFPVSYDGEENVASVPRNPSDYAQPHIGQD